MPWTFEASDLTDLGSQTGDMTLSVSVTAGDLIVLAAGSYDVDVTLSGVTDNASGGSNSYTLGTQRTVGSYFNQRMAYATAKGSEALTITCSYASADSTGRFAAVMVFTPPGSAPETDGVAFGSGEFESGVVVTASDLTTTGDDVICAAFFGVTVDSNVYSDPEIPAGTNASEAEGFTSNTNCAFYQILSGSQLTNEEAEVTIDSTVDWLGEVMAFKSEVSASDWTTHTHQTLVFS